MPFGLSPARSRSPIGIDVGSHAIKAVQLSHAPGRRLHAGTTMRRSAEGPVTSDEAATIAGLLARQGFAGRDVVLSVPWSTLLTGILDLPPRSSGAPLEQLARMELARMHKRDPHGFEMACWELPASSRRGAGTPVMVVACPHGDAETLIETFEGVGLRVTALDVGTLAAARACIEARSLAQGLYGMIDLGHSAARLALFHCGTCIYARAVPESGLGALHARLASALDVDSAVTEYLIEDVGLVGDDAATQADQRALHEAHAAIADYASGLVRELNLSLAYAAHRYPDTHAADVILHGGGAMIPGIAARLTDLSGLSVRAAVTAAVLDVPARLLPRCSKPSLMIAIGLADRSNG
ncbi:MAG: pilus assembly protein PilM [Phycisphaeraceae bacterium]|nr:pilus assembly protein PilM [Phycisphaeraceae bacterium]